MKVTYKMIDKELRLHARLLKYSIVPDKKRFELLIKFGNRLKIKSVEGYDTREHFIKSREKGRSIRVVVYKPVNSNKDIPGLLYMHGGGYIMGSPEQDHGVMKEFLLKRQCVIVSPEYRKSFDRPYPAAIHDCYDTLKWMIKNHEELGFRKDQLFTAGISAGGGLTAAINLMARDLGEINIAYQMPMYPMLDDQMTTDSMKNHDGPIWNEALSKYAWDLYLANSKETSCYAAPSRAESLENLPPLSTFVGSLDPFLDETLDYVKRLKQAGVSAECKVLEGAFHGFEVVNPKAKISIEAKTYILEQFNYAVNHYFKKQPDVNKAI
ncbi:MAG: alpha/beta hydrolase [Clostridiales bacterium]|nr:alpha/beta hydrolase [Clostridiales bacterium]